MTNNRELGFSIKILGTDQQLAELSRVEASLKGLSNEKKELNRLNKEGAITEKQYADSVSVVDLRTKNLRQTKNQLAKAIEVENNVIAKQSGSYNELASTLNRLRQQYRNLSEADRNSSVGSGLLTQISKLDDELKYVDASMGQFQRNVGNYGNTLGSLSPMLGRINSGLMVMGTNIDDVATGGKQGFATLGTAVKSFGKTALTFLLSPVGLILATLGSLFYLIKNNKDTVIAFDSGLKNVSKTTGIVGEELDALGDDIVGLSRKLETVKTDKLLEYATVAGQLGVKGRKNILDFTESLAKLEQASDIAGEAGASNIARFLTLTDGGVENVGKLGDEIVNLGNNFAATENEILDNATAIAQNTGQYDVGRQQALAYATATKAVGLEARLTGSSLGRTLGTFEKAIRTGKNIDTLVQLTGKSVEQLKAQFKDDAASVFTDFAGGLNKVYKEGGSVNEQLEKLGIISIEDQRVIASLATKGYDVLTDSILATADAAGSLDKEFDTASTKLEKQLDRIGIAWDNLVLSLEDGDGVFSALATGAVTIAADALEGITVLINKTGQAFVDLRHTINGTKADAAESMVDNIDKITDVTELNKEINRLKKEAISTPFRLEQKELQEEITLLEKKREELLKVADATKKEEEEAAKRGQTVKDINDAIKAAQERLDNVSSRPEAKIIQEEIEALEKKREAILGASEKQIKAQEKTAKEIQEIIEDNNKTIADLAQQLALAQIEAMEEGFGQEKALLEQQKNDRIAALRDQLVDEKGLTGERLAQAKQINAQINSLIEAEKEAHLRRLNELGLEYGLKEIEDLKSLTDKKVQLYEYEAQLAELKVRERLANEQISEEQAQQEITRIRQENLNQQTVAYNNQQSKLLAAREELSNELLKLMAEEQTEQVKLRIAAIEEELELVDGQNDELVKKLQELKTLIAENGKEKKSDDPNWLSETLGITEQETEKIKQSLMQSINSIYNAIYEQKRQLIQQNLDSELSAIKDTNRKAVEDTEQRYEREKEALERRLRAGQISQQQYNEAIKRLDRNLTGEKLRLETSLQQQEYDARKKAFEENKKLQREQALINGAAGIVLTLASLPYPASLIPAAAQALALAKQLEVINSAKFEKGGILDGPSHSQGGVKIGLPDGSRVEAEGGEAIINKRSTREFAPILSAINAYKGYGKPFDKALRYAAVGGMVPAPAPATTSGGQSYIKAGMTREEMDYLANKLITGWNDKRIILTQSEVESGAKESELVQSTRTW